MLFTLKWLFPYWRRHKRRMLVIVALGLASAALNAVYPYLIKRIINGLGQDITREYLRRNILLILGTGAGAALVGVAAQRNRAWMNMRLEWEFRREVFGHIIGLDRQFFHKYTTGDLVTRLIDDISQKISWFSCSGVFRFIQSAFTLLAAVTMMVLLNRWLAFWVLLPAPFILVASVRTGKKLHARYDALQKTITLIYDFLETCFTGIKLIKANAKEDAQRSFFSARADAQMAAETASARMDITFSYFFQYASFASVAMLYLAGGFMIMKGRATLGDLIAFYFYSGMIMMPLMDISQFFIAGNRAGASIKRVDELLQARSAIRRPQNPLELPGPIERIEVLDVSARGGKDDVQFLHKITFEVRRGQLAAVVGKMGSGKTSLLSLLTRLGEFSSGEILINGSDIRRFAPETLRARTGLVTQSPFILTDTILNNITLGRGNIAEADIERALKVSQLGQDIARLPKGLGTFVGTRGFALSGGQQQRLAIARAVLTMPDLLLFDDATSAMDAQTEENFWRSLREELPLAICIIVTHRAKTIERADIILTLDEGRLSQKGTHRELMSAGGLYRQIYERQKLREELGPA